MFDVGFWELALIFVVALVVVGPERMPALIRTTGPAFNAMPFSPASVLLTPVGSLTITFANGNAALFAYTVTLPGQPGVSQAKAITRQVFRPPGTVCQ